MLEIYLEGHDNYYGIADVMRTFYLRPTEDKDNCRVYCSDVPDMVFCSAVGEDSSSCTSKDGTVSIILPFVTDPVSISREVKRSCYIALSEFLGRKAPWGCLTGIRPTLVAGETGDPKELSEKYFVRQDKAELAMRTCANERDVLSLIPEEDINIYVGIPFCPSRCEYCSFVSSDISHHMDRLGKYLDALENEIRMIGPGIDRRIRTLYLGGGTPTVFGEKDFDRLLDVIYGNLKIGAHTEVTVEAGRPDTITENKLRSMADRGIRRICINPQTMNSETLARLNRLHSAEDTVRVYELARKTGFEVINMDLIAGLKYETASDFRDSVNRLIGLCPENITVHTLYKKRRAAINTSDVLTDDNGVDDAVREGYGLLDKAGYIPYYMYRQKDTGHGLENTGFALPGTECLYNVAMMTDARDVLSFGAGGMSKRVFGSEENKYRVERCSCIKDVIGYMNSSSEMAERKMRFFGII